MDKYEEALKRARELYEAGNFLTRQQMGIVFPELAESEDERIRREMIEFIQWSEDRGMIRHDFQQRKRPGDWIAYLERQKEQKPAEWSEEDERILKGIIGKIDHDQTYGVSRAEMLSFLRSLRPSWKPSEEQMEAFRSYIKDFQEKAEAAVGGWNNFDVMI